MKLTQDKFEELKEMEDAINALDSGYYDTHDLGIIKTNASDFRKILDDYQEVLPYGKFYFNDCVYENGKLI